MNLYLVRHGEAVSKLEDPSRPLSEAGRSEVSGVADFIGGNFRIHLGSIYHSPKARAADTALIMADRLGFAGSVKATDGLLPMDDPAVWAERSAGIQMDTMLVGHLPHLSSLTSLLVGWNSADAIAHFDTATVVCLEGDSRGWMVKWMISPSALKGPGSKR